MGWGLWLSEDTFERVVLNGFGLFMQDNHVCVGVAFGRTYDSAKVSFCGVPVYFYRQREVTGLPKGPYIVLSTIRHHNNQYVHVEFSLTTTCGLTCATEKQTQSNSFGNMTVLNLIELQQHHFEFFSARHVSGIG